MRKERVLEFPCQQCTEQVFFSPFAQGTIVCDSCGKHYHFTEKLQQQLKQFERLCEQICASEEILGNCSVGVDVAGHSVKIPYKLLLTRLTSSLELKIGDHPIRISFRIHSLEEKQ